MKDRDTPIDRIPFLGFKQSEWKIFLLYSYKLWI
jgi:hypothetical protein